MNELGIQALQQALRRAEQQAARSAESVSDLRVTLETAEQVLSRDKSAAAALAEALLEVGGTPLPFDVKFCQIVSSSTDGAREFQRLGKLA